MEGKFKMNRYFGSIILLLVIFSTLFSQSEKLSIAVLELDAHGITDYEAAILTDRLRNELFKTGVFRVMEREQMDEILKEQGFQQTGCTSSECLVQVGQLIGVNRMIGGSVGKVGETFTVSLRLIDVETGEVIKIATKDVFGKIDILLTTTIPQIAKDIVSPSPVTQKGTKDKERVPFSPTGQTYDPIKGTVTDIDGNVYKVIKIGSQVWMAENLKVIHYRDGTPIPNIPNSNEWTSLTTGAYCVYDNNESNAEIYGYLYNWYAVNDSSNIAPEGWHVPTDDEWKQLEMFLGTSAGSKLAGNADLWKNGNLENNATFGESGFFALPGGYRADGDGNFNDVGNYAYFWSSTESIIFSAWYRSVLYNNSFVGRDLDNRNYGFSVRCLRN